MVSKTPGVSAPSNLKQAINLAQIAYDKDPKDWPNNFSLALYYLAAPTSPQTTTPKPPTSTKTGIMISSQPKLFIGMNR